MLDSTTNNVNQVINDIDQTSNSNSNSSSSSNDESTKVGALADGFANTSTNNTTVDDGSNVGAANGDNRNNDSGTHESNNGNASNSNNSSDSSTNVDVDSDIKVAVGNGDDRNNDYDWNYTDNTKNLSFSDDDTTNITKNDNDVITKSISTSDNDVITKNISTSDDDVFTKDNNNTDQSYNNTNSHNALNSNNTDSHNFDLDKADNDFADLDKVLNSGTFGIAGRDLTFDIGDDFSFNLKVDSVLTGGVNGNGFSAVQANNLADQDYADNLAMNNQQANNNLSADGGYATGADGIDMGNSWHVQAGDDISGASTADASAILANSGFHMELVQGANMLSNAVDATLAGDNVSHVGEDTSGS